MALGAFIFVPRAAFSARPDGRGPFPRPGAAGRGRALPRVPPGRRTAPPRWRQSLLLAEAWRRSSPRAHRRVARLAHRRPFTSLAHQFILGAPAIGLIERPLGIGQRHQDAAFRIFPNLVQIDLRTRNFKGRQSDGQRPDRLVPGEAAAIEPGEVDAVADVAGHDQGLARGEAEPALARRHHRDEAGAKAGQPALVAHRQQGRLGDRRGDRRRAARVRAATASRARAPSNKRGERGNEGRAASAGERPSLPLRADQAAPLEIDEMRQHRAAGGGMQARDRRRGTSSRPSPGSAPRRARDAPGSASRACAGARSAPRTWAVRILDGGAVRREIDAGRRGRAAGRGSPCKGPCRRRAARRRWSTSPSHDRR